MVNPRFDLAGCWEYKKNYNPITKAIKICRNIKKASFSICSIDFMLADFLLVIQYLICIVLLMPEVRPTH